MLIELKPSHTKTFPGDIPTDKRRISLSGARNEVVSFKVALRSENKAEVIDGVTVSFDGKTMIYVEGFMNITTLSTIEGTIDLHPDILIPDVDEFVNEKRNAFPLRLEGRTRSLRIEARIPMDMEPGQHLLKLKIGKEEVMADLEVLDFALPEKPSLATWFPTSYEKLAPGHGLPDSEREYLRGVYAKASLRNRITPDILVFAPPMGLDNIVNFAEVDRVMAPWWDGITSFRIKNSKFTVAAIGHTRAVLYYRQWAKYLDMKGQLQKAFVFPVDEPRTPEQWAIIAAEAKAAKEADPRLRLMATASIQHSTEAGAASRINLFCPTIRYMDNKPGGQDIGSVEPPGGAGTIGNQRSKYGPSVWWYQACGSHGCDSLGGGPEDPNKYRTGWPSYMIDLPVMYRRIMPWLTYLYNVQGELYYDTVQAYGERDPWKDQFLFSGNGDGTLFYPGTPAMIGGTKHIPVESSRLKDIRDGMDNYEYMVLAEKKVGRAAVLAEISSVVTNAYTWTKDPDILMACRQRLAKIIAEKPPVIPPIVIPPVTKTIEGTVSIGGEIFKFRGPLEKI